MPVAVATVSFVFSIVIDPIQALISNDSIFLVMLGSIFSVDAYLLFVAILVSRGICIITVIVAIGIWYFYL